MADDDPPASLLTNSQRELLNDDDPDISEGAKRKMQSRIRERVEWGIHDLALLFQELPDDEIEKVFGTEWAVDEDPDDAAEAHEAEIPTVHGYVPTALAFFVRALQDSDAQVFENVDARQQPALADFGRGVERAIKKFLAAEKQTSAEVTVSIQLDNLMPTEALAKRIQQEGRSPTLHEQFALHHADDETSQATLDETLPEAGGESRPPDETSGVSISSGVLDLDDPEPIPGSDDVPDEIMEDIRESTQDGPDQDGERVDAENGTE